MREYWSAATFVGKLVGDIVGGHVDWSVGDNVGWSVGEMVGGSVLGAVGQPVIPAGNVGEFDDVFVGVLVGCKFVCVHWTGRR